MSAKNASLSRQITYWMALAIPMAGVALAAYCALAGSVTDEYMAIATLAECITICALLYAAFAMIDRKSVRGAGLLLMTLVLMLALLDFIAMFTSSPVVPAPVAAAPGSFSQDVAWTAVFLLLMTPAAVLLFQTTRHAISRVAGFAGIVLLGAAMVCCLASVWLPHTTNVFFVNIDPRWIGSAGFLFELAITVAAILPLLHPWQKYLRLLGLISALVAYALSQYNLSYSLELYPNEILVFNTIAVAIAFCNLLYLFPLTPRQRWLRVAVIVSASLFAGVHDWHQIYYPNAFSAQPSGKDEASQQLLIFSFGVAAGCGAVAIAILSRFNRRFIRSEPATVFAQLQIICPHCNLNQLIAVGDSHCTGCGMNISVKISEPHCTKCDYVLLMTKSDRCPECGEPIGRYKVKPDSTPVAAVL
jgi:hypothetical protein